MRTGFITIAGRSNVGKSTLLNAIIGEKIAIVSDKPQTTRNKIAGIYNRDDLQIVFVDTPGLHAPKNKLGERMIREAEEAMDGIDGAIVVAEPRSPGKTEKNLISRFQAEDIPIILVLNKADITPKEQIAEAIGQYAALCEFASIVPASALKKDNVDALLDEVEKLIAPEDGAVYYPTDIATDQTVRKMASEFIREKILRALSAEVPHGIAVHILSFRERSDKPITEISAEIVCEKDSHKGIIIGKNGRTLKKIASLARADLESLLDRKVFLECFVKVRTAWRDDERFLENEYEQ